MPRTSCKLPKPCLGDPYVYTRAELEGIARECGIDIMRQKPGKGKKDMVELCAELSALAIPITYSQQYDLDKILADAQSKKDSTIRMLWSDADLMQYIIDVIVSHDECQSVQECRAATWLFYGFFPTFRLNFPSSPVVEHAYATRLPILRAIGQVIPSKLEFAKNFHLERI